MDTVKKTGFFTRLTRQFFVRTFASYLLMITPVLMLVYLLSINTIRGFYMADLKSHLGHMSQALSPKVMELLRAKDKDGMDRLVKQLGKKVEVRITVIAPDGTVMADSEKDPLHMTNHRNRPEVAKAMRGETEEVTRFSATVRENMIYLAVPLDDHQRPSAVIRLSLHLKNVKLLMAELAWKFASALIGVFFAAVLMIWYLSRRLSNPVQQIASATRKFASGDFNVKIFMENKDELSDVAESFNHMVEEQKKLFNELSENREELRAIISSMKEGLMVIDRNGKITLSNRYFEEHAGKRPVVGKAYWEVFRISGFDDLVKRAFDSGESFYEEVEFNHKTFLVGFNSMSRGSVDEKVVAVFTDITGFKQLEKMKKEFVVNLTHELKTPLTAIKGFIETLEEEEDIQNPQYVDIIKRHTDRMNRIVSDMLTLSELEAKRQDMEFEPLDLRDMATNILKIYREKIREKNLTLEIDIADDLPLVQGERFKMEQVFVNLVDNAVKYTDEGTISLTIRRIEKNRVNIRVANTGAPIPAKSLPRIFERFYVVDKSRSRKLGGTGLGLSIVKHAALLHKGDVSVESSEEKGTVFTVVLPVSNPG
ncbi:MAG: ATP-binding protein [Candidatus Omnitrophota bacterium]